MIASHLPRRAALLLLLLLRRGRGGAEPGDRLPGRDRPRPALRRLGTTKRVLMIGAHPDDESTQILSTLALGAGGPRRLPRAHPRRGRPERDRAGAPGGPRPPPHRGAARGARAWTARRQFFTRAYDFGFSKSADEAFRHWPRDSLLADVVAAIRAFRPDVVVTVFTGTPARRARSAPGRRHPRAGGVRRRRRSRRASPSRSPPGCGPGPPPSSTRRSGGPDSLARVRCRPGAFDPLLGRSYYQVAMASRSRHRSQDMGRALASRAPDQRPPAPARPAPRRRLDGGALQRRRHHPARVARRPAEQRRRRARRLPPRRLPRPRRRGPPRLQPARRGADRARARRRPARPRRRRLPRPRRHPRGPLPPGGRTRRRPARPLAPPPDSRSTRSRTPRPSCPARASA